MMQEIMIQRETISVAILFADIAGSTQIYDTLGDKRAQRMVVSCLSTLSDVTRRHGGTVIKTIGDEVMATFPCADKAVEAASDMHQTLDQMSVFDGLSVFNELNFLTPNISVGIHFGEVIIEENDVFGDAVNVAARMASLAKQRQIITTEETVKTLKPAYQKSVKHVGKATIKGKKGVFDIYEYVWEEHAVTFVMNDKTDTIAMRSSMELRYLGDIFKVDRFRPSVTFGRQSHNDIMLKGNHVSRSHASIEFRGGRFVLIDQSSNGTYVYIEGEQSVLLRRDEIPIHGRGIFGFGKEVDAASPDAVHFCIK